MSVRLERHPDHFLQYQELSHVHNEIVSLFGHLEPVNAFIAAESITRTIYITATSILLEWAKGLVSSIICAS